MDFGIIVGFVALGLIVFHMVTHKHCKCKD